MDVTQQEGALGFTYRVAGDLAGIVLPPPTAAVRQDGLWQTTCLEAFVRRPSGYAEFNLSPSGAWAAYDFTDYREGMRPRDMASPGVSIAQDGTHLYLSAVLPGVAGSWGIAAVIEEKGGRKSYWALAHPAAKPDFHHPDNFLLTFPGVA